MDSEIEQIVQLESALAKLKRPLEERRDEHLIYNKMTVQELSNRTHFDWAANVFAPMWRHTGTTVPFGPQSHVIVSDVNYVVKTIELIARTPSRVLQNYFGWRVVESLSKYSTDTFRQIRFQFYKVKDGIVKLEDKWRACLALIKQTQLEWGLSRLYVDHHASAKDEKMEVSI